MKRAIEYQANDGTRFATADECRRHEQASFIVCMVGMNNEQVNNALARTDVHLANAIELAGKLIAERRRAMGDMKRKRKTIDERAAEVDETIAGTKAKKSNNKKS